MQTKKMSLANIQGKLSRAEMKNIMAGSGSGCRSGSCSLYVNGTTYHGFCSAEVVHNGGGTYNCRCFTSYGSYIPTNYFLACAP